MRARELYEKTVGAIGAEKREKRARHEADRAYVEENFDLSAEGAFATYFGEEIAGKIPRFTGKNENEVFDAIRNLDANVPTVAQMREILERKRAALSRQRDAHAFAGAPHEYLHASPHRIEHDSSHESHSAEDDIPDHVEIEYAEALDLYHAGRQQERIAEAREEIRLAREDASNQAINDALEELRAGVRALMKDKGAKVMSMMAHGAPAEAEHEAPHESGHADHDHGGHEAAAPMSHFELRRKIDELTMRKLQLRSMFRNLNTIEFYTTKPGHKKGQENLKEDLAKIPAYLKEIRAIDDQITKLEHQALEMRFPRGHKEPAHEAAERRGHTTGHEGDGVPRETDDSESLIDDDSVLSRVELTKLNNALEFTSPDYLGAPEAIEAMRKYFIAHERAKRIAELRAAGVPIPEDIARMERGDADLGSIDEIHARMAAHAEEFPEAEEEADLSLAHELELRGVMQELMKHKLLSSKGFERLTGSLHTFAEFSGGVENPQTVELLYSQVLFAAQGDGRKTGVILPPAGIQHLAELISHNFKSVKNGSPSEVLRRVLKQLPNLIEKAKNDSRLKETFETMFGSEAAAKKYLNEVKARASRLKDYAH